MGWAYSVDLRERVVAAFDRAGMTDEEAAALFKVGEATVRRWKRLKRETGALVRRPGGGGNPPRVAPDRYDVVRSIVGEKPDLTDQEVACGLDPVSWTPSERRLRCLTSPQKLDGFQLEEVASMGPSVLTTRANSIGVRLPIELWGRLSL